MDYGEALQRFKKEIEWEGWYGDDPFVRIQKSFDGKLVAVKLDGDCPLDYLRKIVAAWEKLIEANGGN